MTLSMNKYWDCFDRDKLLDMVKNGKINYFQANDITFLVNKFRRFVINMINPASIKLNMNISSVKITSYNNVVSITVPVFYKFDILPLLTQKNIKFYTKNEFDTVTFIFPDEDVIIVTVEDKKENKKFVFFIGYGFELLIYEHSGVPIIESYPVLYSIHLRVNFYQRTIELLPKEISTPDEYDEEVIERCLFIKDLDDVYGRIERKLFTILRKKYEETKLVRHQYKRYEEFD